MRYPTETFRLSACLMAVGMLAACAVPATPQRVEQSQPTVSYQYDGSDEQLEMASADADEYCVERYGETADLIDTDEAEYDTAGPTIEDPESDDVYDYEQSYGTGMVATFECG